MKVFLAFAEFYPYVVSMIKKIEVKGLNSYKYNKMHYQIKLIGTDRSPRKPWLNIDKSGYSFDSEVHAHKFNTITEAKGWLDHLKACDQNVFMTWHDDSENAKEFYGSWGEVNQNYLKTL